MGKWKTKGKWGVNPVVTSDTVLMQTIFNFLMQYNVQNSEDVALEHLGANGEQQAACVVMPHNGIFVLMLL